METESLVQNNGLKYIDQNTGTKMKPKMLKRFWQRSNVQQQKQKMQKKITIMKQKWSTICNSKIENKDKEIERTK